MNTNFRFIHCADLHLDAPFKGISLNDKASQELLRNSTFHAFEKIIHTAIAQQVDFILISGDVYNSSDKSLRAQLFFLKQMECLYDNNIPCFLVHGNHDPLNGWEIQTNFPDNVYRFSSHVSCETLFKNGEALVNVVGYSYPKRKITKNIALAINDAADKQTNKAFTIGLLHCNVGKDTTTENYAPCSLSDLVQSSVNYWALGHIHTKHIIQEESPSVVYAGNPQGLHINDNSVKGFYLVSVNHNKIELDFIETSDFRWFNEVLQVTDSTIPDVICTLKQIMLGKSQDIPGIFRFQLEGHTSLHNDLRQKVSELEETIQEDVKGEPCFLESIKIKTKPMLEFKNIQQKQDFNSIFLQKISDLSAEKNYQENIKSLLNDFSAHKLTLMLPKRGLEIDWGSILAEAKLLGLDYLLENENED